MFSFSLWFWALLALLFFWAIGAYNRLVRLRSTVVKAFAVLDEQLVRQLVWVQGCLPGSLHSCARPPNPTAGSTRSPPGAPGSAIEVLAWPGCQ